jgi:hypothetical protein
MKMTVGRPCILCGTRILTSGSGVRVEDLAIGALVETSTDHCPSNGLDAKGWGRTAPPGIGAWVRFVLLALPSAIGFPVAICTFPATTAFYRWLSHSG